MQDNLLNYTGLTQYDGKIKEYIGDSAGTKIISVTQAQYDALTQAQKESGTYFITDANGGTYSADNCTYDNTDSELDATNVQDAIDEVESRVDTAETTVNNVNSKLKSGADYIRYQANDTNNRKILAQFKGNDSGVTILHQQYTDNTETTVKNKLSIDSTSSRIALTTLVNGSAERIFRIPPSGSLLDLVKIVKYTNASAFTINRNSNKSIALTTSTDTTGYAFIGIRDFYSGSNGLTVTRVANSTLTLCNNWQAEASLTVNAGVAYVNALYIRTEFY